MLDFPDSIHSYIFKHQQKYSSEYGRLGHFQHFWGVKMRDLQMNEIAVVSGAGAISTVPVVRRFDFPLTPIVITIPVPPPVYEFPIVPNNPV